MSFDAVQAVRAYLADCWQARQYGNPSERTFYTPLQALLTAVGATVKPKVFALIESAAVAAAGSPDFGLFSQSAVRRAAPDEATPLAVPPDRGVVEVKLPRAELHGLVRSRQVEDYWQRHGLVLATTLRAFQVVGHDPAGRLAPQERFVLADSEAEFWALCRRPADLPAEKARACAEFLWRALQARVSLFQPRDVAAILASYAREALVRLEAIPSIGRAEDLDALDAVRKSLERALGIAFEGDKGEHFFRSTLVQTLFYGLFSAWVMWRRKTPDPQARGPFSMEHAVWLQRLPVIQDLVGELITPSAVHRLHVKEILEWAAEALARVDEAKFFERFRQDQAVQYFYEPFLEAYDPELRRQLGVWYTPHEVVDYMVERVDRTLRTELDCPDGLADERVVVLDPCCGTGSYLVAVLGRIERTLKAKGDDALVGQKVKRAAMERVVGFEIMPAPFVVAHLQVELLMQQIGAPLAEEQGTRRAERAKVLLTNALTGWDKTQDPPGYLPLPHFQNELDAARKVKREAPILVVLGNPPYNGFAGVSESVEERELTRFYRSVRKVRPPEGQGLNDLYVRFFRMADRRIAEMSGRGMVCFISNYSWLDGLSFTGMRERLLSAFDRIWIDCLNGDKYKTGKVTPDGRPDPSIFSTEHNREGIQVGTAIASLLRLHRDTQSRSQNAMAKVTYRDFWGREKWQQLEALAGTEPGPKDALPGYAAVDVSYDIGLRFRPTIYIREYFDWPSLDEVFSAYFSGINTARDGFLVAFNQEEAEQRLKDFLNKQIEDRYFRMKFPHSMIKTRTFDPRQVREEILSRSDPGMFVAQMDYRPFDHRFLIYEPSTNLLDRSRPPYMCQVFMSNVWLIASEKLRRERIRPQFSRSIASYHLMERASNCFSLLISDITPDQSLPAEEPADVRTNLSGAARRYLEGLGLAPAERASAEALFFHLFAVMHADAYEADNADALREGWPRIPLPASAARLAASAALGRRVAALLDSATAVDGVTAGEVRPELRAVAALRKATPPGEDDDFRVRARWGYRQKSGAVFPGPGEARPRAYTEAERAAILAGGAALGLSAERTLALLGAGCVDVYLNETAWWACVPEGVWRYTIGGYQVLKKWLSYREHELLGRPLKTEELEHLRDTARRLAALLLLEPELDANYRAVVADTYAWPRDEGAA